MSKSRASLLIGRALLVAGGWRAVWVVVGLFRKW
jgi:hypothetical protein